MYLVTGMQAGAPGDDRVFAAEGRDTVDKARQLAENWAMNGYDKVEVWLRTHSVCVKPQAIWQEHAKGLSGV